MKEIYEKLGFSDEAIAQHLSSLRHLHNKRNNATGYRINVDKYNKEIKVLQKAKDNLKDALDNLSPSVAANISTQLNHFRSAIYEFERLGDISVNIHGTGPINKKRKVTNKSTQIANCFILHVATIYREQTNGKKPTLSIPTNYENSTQKSGQFIEFLHACAEDIGIPTNGLPRRAQELIEENEI